MSAHAPEKFRGIDEIDLRIINALQWSPRSTWLALSDSLGLDAATLARRWTRLTDANLAWVTLTPGARVLEEVSTTLVELTCAPHRTADTVRALAALPHAATIEEISEPASLLVTTGTDSFSRSVELVRDTLTRLPGVEAIRTHVVTRWFAQGGAWRLDALAPGEEPDASAPHPRSGRPLTPTRITPDDRRVLAALAADGRTPMRDLARIAGTGPQATKRRLDRLLSARLVGFRCEFARPAAGFNVLATLWCSVPPARLDDAGRAAARMPEVRNAFAVVASANLVVQVWLHSPGELPGVEARLAADVPGLTIVDRAINLRLHKLFGTVLDEHGRRVETVVPDVWTDQGIPPDPAVVSEPDPASPEED
ncbi:Lrp/AsnC family transcriptional regulator [Rhodococcus sp. HNM0569]|uniref:Lrp/AsnC family transcriptional regulator n=1 Tax=Rhodococcus sp. HNM0569 TaxID=2716340 RepID=UPI00146E8ECE|nr:Lrp/AsnC family transcriptional regulator [Rhodococcus sp. HNM0569]NLU83061.1 Lrp/AsnC family transcriptional regulator [Rhodococcus sp. HNM0569]